MTAIASAAPLPSSLPTVDCRGMRCPAPILRLAKAAQKAGAKPMGLMVLADDADFPKDLEAWCRTTKTALQELEERDGVYRAVLGLNGAEAPLRTPPSPRRTAPPQATAAAPASPSPPRSAPAPASGEATAPRVAPLRLDLRGRRAPEPVAHLSTLLVTHPEARVVAVSDDPTFLADVRSWAGAMGVSLGRTRESLTHSVVELMLPARRSGPLPTPDAPPARPAPSAALAVAEPALLAECPAGVAPRENRCAILVLHNDFESLMAGLIVANGAAAQGMKVDVYFSFWGVNLLRGERPRKEEPPSRVGFLQRLMKWMMPRGPRRQRMSKMHLGGVGKGMMEHFMKRQGVMTLPELLDSTVELDVTLTVCTMSMGIMGIEKRDIMELPNIAWGGVSSFVESSKRASMSLVF